jgi:hypothetical protein
MDAVHWPLVLVAALATLLLLVGIGVSVRACLRRAAGWEADALLLIWTLAPLALMTWQSSQVYIHYVLCLVPVPFVLMARGAIWLAGPGVSPMASLRARVVGTLVLAILAVQIVALAAFYAAIDRSATAPPTALTPTEAQARLNESDLKARQLGIGELHGLPLRYWMSVANRTRQFAQASGIRDVTVVTGIQDDGARWLDKRRKALNYLLGPDLRPRFPLEGLVVVPTAEPVLFVTIPEEEVPRVVQRAGTRLASIPYPGTNGASAIYQVRPRPTAEVVPLRKPLDAALGQGVHLIGVDPPTHVRPGQTAPLFVFLSVDQPPGAADDDAVAPRVELVDDAGRVRVGVSRGGLPSGEWRPGDLLIQAMSLTVPIDVGAGDYELRVRLAPADDPDDATSSADNPAVPATILHVRDES